MNIYTWFYIFEGKINLNTRMMRLLLINILFLAGINLATAQISSEPSCLLLEANEIEEIYYDINITNSGSEMSSVFWEFTPDTDFPEDWKFQICDLNLCYNWDVSRSGTSSFLANNLEAGTVSKFTIKIQNKANTADELFNITGESFGTLRLFENSDFVDPVYVTSCIVANKNIEVEDLVIYPNPTTDVFQIKNDANIKTVSIFNIVGRQISASPHSEGTIHDVSNLRAGVYLVRLENQDGELVKAMRLSKK